MTDLLFVRAGRVPYERAWAEQRRLHESRVAEAIPDTCLLLEHDPVYTAGRRTEPWERPFDGTPVIDVDRGGKITWHGPGQLVGYPIRRLPMPIDVVGYVRDLEGALIHACAELGVATARVDSRSGVWVPADARGPARKIAAIGVRVSRRVTMHGFGLNCDCDLSAFDRIVPCGIRDAAVTSLTTETGRSITVAEATPVVERHLAAVFGAGGSADAVAGPGPSPSMRDGRRSRVGDRVGDRVETEPTRRTLTR